jgi:tetratricopeptide (TPR) repeat protein
MKYLWAYLPLLILMTAVRADVLVLDDGTRVEGKAHKDGDHWVVIDNAGQETDVPADRIVSFQLGRGQSGGTAAQRLADLRSSVDGLHDLPTIIQRFQAFVDQNPGTPEAEQAKADLATWQQRLDQNCVKIGKQWLTPGDRDKLIASEVDNDDRIGLLIQQSQLEDAAQAAQQALELDPGDPTAMYMYGVVLDEQEKVGAARNQFEAVNKIVSQHAPTLNNLAVELSRSNLHPLALGIFTQAMQASPVNQTILDNVAEGLHAVTHDEHNAPQVIAAAKLFVEQDELLQKKLKDKGLRRWGAKWVTDEQFAKLQAEEDAIKNRLDLIQSDYDSTQRDADADAATINSDTQDMQQMMQFQNVQIGSGPVGVRGMPGGGGRGGPAMGYNSATIGGNTVLPQRYYDDQTEINRMTADRQKLLQHMADLSNEAQSAQQSVSVPMYTGMYKLFGPEGAPIRTGTTSPLITPVN